MAWFQEPDEREVKKGDSVVIRGVGVYRLGDWPGENGPLEGRTWYARPLVEGIGLDAFWVDPGNALQSTRELLSRERAESILRLLLEGNDEKPAFSFKLSEAEAIQMDGEPEQQAIYLRALWLSDKLKPTVKQVRFELTKCLLSELSFVLDVPPRTMLERLSPLVKLAYDDLFVRYVDWLNRIKPTGKS